MSSREMRWAMRQRVGGLQDKFLLVLMGDLAEADGWYGGGKTYLAQIAECSLADVNTSLDRLASARLITQGDEAVRLMVVD